MTDEPKAPKTIEELETEIFSLKIRLRRLEEFIEAMPAPSDYLGGRVPYTNPEDEDELYEEAVKIVRQYDKASSSLIQRRLSIGYARAARLMDMLESKGVVSASDGSSKPREVLIQKEEEK